MLELGGCCRKVRQQPPSVCGEGHITKAVREAILYPGSAIAALFVCHYFSGVVAVETYRYYED